MDSHTLLLYCRPGFEKECAAEITDVAGAAQLYGYAKTKPGDGFVLFKVQHEPGAALSPENLSTLIRFDQLVFARQLVLAVEKLDGLPVDDRISPLLDHLARFDRPFVDAWLETADTNEGKQLSGFCKKFAPPLKRAMQDRQLLDSLGEWRLHALLLDSSTLYTGLSHIHNSSDRPMGIRRLKMPRAAPSRSTLKLEEALLTLLSEQERSRYLTNGMSAVDLGACPGGWTWQLVRRDIRVDAVDNGDMDAALMDTGLVRHIRADGFKYRPQKPVDWLVCDMVERPLHITRLICRWIKEGLCSHSVFNLKLPMKQRYPMVVECRQLIQDELTSQGIEFDLRMKQLYHDREEITCVLLSGGH